MPTKAVDADLLKNILRDILGFELENSENIDFCREMFEQCGGDEEIAKYIGCEWLYEEE